MSSVEKSSGTTHSHNLKQSVGRKAYFAILNKGAKEAAALTTSASSVPSFECKYCHKKYGYLTNLKRHMRIHTQEGLKSCHLCGKSFAEAHHLTYHVRTHTGEKPFKCDVCNKEFLDKPHLNRHKFIHATDKPFKCTECARSFAQKSQLSLHRGTHSNDKVVCRLCGKEFSSLIALKTHNTKKHY